MRGASSIRRSWPGLLLATAVVGALAAFVAINGSGGFSIRHPAYLLGSLGFLALGMACQFLVWHLTLRIAGVTPGLRTTFLAHGLTIWAKYIPGKIWSLAGRAALVARYGGTDFPRCALASGIAQTSMILAGVVVGWPLVIRHPGVLGLSERSVAMLSILVIGMIITLGGLFLWKRTKSQTNAGSPARIVPVIGFSIATWVFWGLAFLALVRMSGATLEPIAAAAAFATATTAGILAVITPGGLGIREGALAALLVAEEFSLASASSAALTARIWFLGGELLVFLVALGTRAARPA